MPAFSIYLDDATMASIREMAKKRKIPASRLVQEALARYLKMEERPQARRRVRQTLQNQRPLGPSTDWTEIHRERTDADANRT